MFFSFNISILRCRMTMNSPWNPVFPARRLARNESSTQTKLKINGSTSIDWVYFICVTWPVDVRNFKSAHKCNVAHKTCHIFHFFFITFLQNYYIFWFEKKFECNWKEIAADFFSLKSRITDSLRYTFEWAFRTFMRGQ